MKKITQKELNKILELHKKWLKGEERGKRADLRYTNLSNTDLSDANLSDANLRGANLSIADLSDANLSDANLSDANLSNADLSNANLRYTNLRGADLSNANLRYTNLSDANLSNADLSDANLSIADLRGADLSDADLRGANLSNAKGMVSKKEEMKTAKQLLANIKKVNGTVKMSVWHTCGTIHCIAGWLCPEIELPATKAAIKSPTLAKYFYKTNLTHDEAIEIIERVARGEESYLD